jgi:catechol-2,3-dioxygenase
MRQQVVVNTVRHVGIVVNDLAKTKDFWINLMGFKPHTEEHEPSPYIDELLGISQPNLRTMKLIDSKKFIVELLKFENTNSNKFWLGNMQSIGLTHIALTVSDLEKLVSKLKGSSYDTFSRIMVPPAKALKVVFVKGPEGLILELVQED